MTPADPSSAEVWFSTRRGFRLGVAGWPDDRGTLRLDVGPPRFDGRRFAFSLDRPVRLSLVHEPPGLAPLGGVALMALGVTLAGAATLGVLIALGVVALLLGANAAASRWVRLEQLDEDGDTTTAYLTPAGIGRYTSAPRELLARLEGRVASPVRRL